MNGHLDYLWLLAVNSPVLASLDVWASLQGGYPLLAGAGVTEVGGSCDHEQANRLPGGVSPEFIQHQENQIGKKKNGKRKILSATFNIGKTHICFPCGFSGELWDFNSATCTKRLTFLVEDGNFT